MPTPKLTNEIITAAILGFEAQKKNIDNQISELKVMLSGGSAKTTATLEAPTRKRKKFSAAARHRMKEAQQRRWARIRGESEPPAPATVIPAKKKKRKLSAAGKAAIVAALRKRWAAKRAEAAKTATKKAAGKKAAPKGKLSPARKAALLANLAKARAARAAKKH
jgi:hypothetical protein